MASKEQSLLDYHKRKIVEVKCIEFADWIKKQKITVVRTPNGDKWGSSYIGSLEIYTSKELYQKFIKP